MHYFLWFHNRPHSFRASVTREKSQEQVIFDQLSECIGDASHHLTRSPCKCAGNLLWDLLQDVVATVIGN